MSKKNVITKAMPQAITNNVNIVHNYGDRITIYINAKKRAAPDKN